MIALAFFDSRITVPVKRLMVKALNKKSVSKNNYRVDILKKNIKKIQIETLISEKTKEFFKLHNICTDFLKKDPSLWCSDESYNIALKKIKDLKVTNDVAEGAIALAQKYSGKITRNENQFQYLLLGVRENIKMFPTCKKSVIQNSI